MSSPKKTHRHFGRCHSSVPVRHQPQFFVLLCAVIWIRATSAMVAHDNWNVPCRYVDSVNITGLPVHVNGRHRTVSVTFDNHTYSPDLIGEFDYEILNETYRQPTVRHPRLCVCQNRPCVRLRCPRGQSIVKDACEPDARMEQLSIPVRMANGELQTLNLFDSFGVTIGKQCEIMTALEPDRYPDDAWELHQNGDITTVSGLTYTQQNYTLDPAVNASTGQIYYTMLYCFSDYVESVRDALLPYGILLSVPFLFLTFLVYAILPELRNVHGKSLMCYLASLTNAYVLLAFVQMHVHINAWYCRPFGYLVYFWFMASFFWLNVISFDLWWNFRGIQGINKLNETRKFLVYSAYAWGIPSLMVLFAFMMDSCSWVPSSLQPGFGLMRCYFKMERSIEFFYFYLPMAILMAANAVCFTLTALKIRRVQQEMARITSKEDSRRHKSHLEKEKDKFGLFLRLFIVMGVTWSMEVASWLISPTGWPFYLSDGMNAIQGIVIFGLFVLKPKVKQLLIKRWRIWRNIRTDSRGVRSSATSSNPAGSLTTTTSVVTTPGESAMLMRSLQNNKNPATATTPIDGVHMRH